MKRLLSLLLVLAVALGCSALAFADGGSGDNRDEPITLVSSTLADGAVITGDTLAVRLEFNKNVVNLSVREHNMGRFALYDEGGRQLPLTVQMGDDQVDPDAKRVVDLSASGLEPGSYRLVVLSGLMAKNGTSLDGDIELRFRVEGAAPEQPAEPEEPAAPEEPAGAQEPAQPEEPSEAGEAAQPEQPGESEQPAAADGGAQEAGAKQGGFTGTAVLIGVILVGGAAALLGRSRAKSS